MAYDRYDTRRDRWQGDRHPDDDRGFFEKAGDEIASWFGDDEAERRRREDERMNRGWDRDRDWGRDNDRYAYRGSDRNRNRDRDWERSRDNDRESYRPMNWTSSDSDYRSSRPRSSRDWDRYGYSGYDRDYSSRGGMGDYSSPTGPSFGYGGAYGAGTSGGYGSSGYGYGSDQGHERDRDWDTSYAGSSRDHDRHYHAWRQRQLDDLDRDYDLYNRERQQRFENDFGSWRQNRMNKRQQLGGIREHMDVVGSDGETVGKVDHVRGDHIVLTRSDSPDNRHHSIDCSMVQSVEGDQVRLDIPSDEAKNRWEDAENRGFFGRDREQGHNLDQAFSGTYES